MHILRPFSWTVCIAALAMFFWGCEQEREPTKLVVVGVHVNRDFPEVSMTSPSWGRSELWESTDELHGGRKFTGQKITAEGKSITAVAAIDKANDRVEMIINSTVPYRLKRRLEGNKGDDQGGNAATDEIPAGSRTIYFSLSGTKTYIMRPLKPEESGN